MSTREYKGFTIELIPDDDAENPKEWADGPCFLLHYHRQFTHYPKGMPTHGQAYVDWLGENYYEVPKDEREWLVFPLESYIHGGVMLAFEGAGNFPDRQWDVSRCGSILVKKSELWRGADPQKLAEAHLAEWNMYLSGDIWGFKVLDAEGEEVDLDVCWGNYGEENAFQQAQEAIDVYLEQDHEA